MPNRMRCLFTKHRLLQRRNKIWVWSVGVRGISIQTNSTCIHIDLKFRADVLDKESPFGESPPQIAASLALIRATLYF